MQAVTWRKQALPHKGASRRVLHFSAGRPGSMEAQPTSAMPQPRPQPGHHGYRSLVAFRPQSAFSCCTVSHHFTSPTALWLWILTTSEDLPVLLSGSPQRPTSMAVVTTSLGAIWGFTSTCCWGTRQKPSLHKPTLMEVKSKTSLPAFYLFSDF